MNALQKTAKDIKSIKIQGATNVSKAAINAIMIVSKKSKSKSKAKFVSELLKAQKILCETRATEPQMRNALRLIVQNTKESSSVNVDDLRKIVLDTGQKLLKDIETSRKHIAEFASNSIRNGMTVFTHCHSSTVINAFRRAKKHGKKFEVICTETRPLYQGRKTAKECIKLGIPTTMIVDSNVSEYIRKADMVMVGADLITANESFLNKVGTQNTAYAAKRAGIPFYVCTDLIKFEPETVTGKPGQVEQRNPDEVWKKRPKKLKIPNPAFDLVPRELITAFITQEGFVTPGSVQDTIKDRFSWILSGIATKHI